MSDIRFNRWLHQSGTGGVSQDSSGNIGIGTTVPTKALDVRGDVNIGNTININNASGIISATTFTGTTGTFSGNVSAVDATFTGNVTIGGTLTYEDVANIDAVGIITAQSDIIVGGGLTVTGISTFNNDVKLLDNDKLKFGISEDLQIYHTGNHSRIYDSGVGKLQLGSDTQVEILNGAFSVPIAQFNPGGSVVLRHNTTTRLETTNTGAVVTGILTATTFSGNLTGNVTGDLTGNLAGISSIATISSSITDTAVDVFVYDTRKDSDGGAWRKRTQHTSWYNETLNTATRGSRKEFPAVAVIVAETTKVTIYDGDDPDLPMWMVFTWSGNVDNLLGYSNRAKSAITAVNGYLITCSDPDGIHIARFIHDDGIRYTHVNHVYTSDAIANRTNTTYRMISNNSPQLLVAATCNDITATVLPNAPIDEVSGLPVPTIAVATDGGISVIKHNNTVISTSGSSYIHEVEFTDDHGLNAIISNTGGANWACVYVNDFDTLNGLSYGTYNNWDGVVYRTKYDPKALTYKTASTNDTISGFIDLGNRSSAISVPAIGGGLTLFEKSPKDSFDPDSGMVAFIATDYNTGYLHGDIKGAFLSDTDATNVTGSELITNGTFGSNISSWTTVQATTSWQSGVLRIVPNASVNGAVYQSITTEVGKRYTVSMEVVAAAANWARLHVGTSTDINSADKYTYTGNTAVQNVGAGKYSVSFTPTTTTTIIWLEVGGGAQTQVDFDNISVRLAEEDRSVNKKGLQVHGTITKSAVATGADLVAYSGFTASNYLQQPYNSDLDFGTGDFSIMFWYKATAGDYTAQCFLHRGDGGVGTWGSGKIIQIEFNSTNLAAFLANSAFSGYDTVAISGATAASGQWQHYTLIRRGTFVGAYLDGELKDSTSSSRDLSNTSAKTWIGERPNNSRPLDTTSLALFRMSASAPSDEQIKKIYNDEKHLYQENAKCTLDGTSDAVNALAFDDTTKLLHVGTSTGRNDFQGLRRINNTTTAVATAISASDELIAEQ